MQQAGDYFVSGQDLWQWRLEARQKTASAQVPVAEVDWLLQEVAGLDRLALRLESFKTLPEIRLTMPLPGLNRLWQQRLDERVPVQYLVGSAPWRQFSLQVSPAVLIPRPETEGLIDLAIAAVQHQPTLSQGHWADLGTGSGAIALSLADALPQATIHAVDCSEAALAIAQSNAQHLNLTSRVRLYHGSWFHPLNHLQGRLSAMMSNPPYIPSADLPHLQPEVERHEPHLALDGGTDGLDSIRHLVATAPSYLHPGGLWLIEMMAGQAEAVVDLLTQQGRYRDISIHPDLAGIERFAMAHLYLDRS